MAEHYARKHSFSLTCFRIKIIAYICSWPSAVDQTLSLPWTLIFSFPSSFKWKPCLSLAPASCSSAFCIPRCITQYFSCIRLAPCRLLTAKTLNHLFIGNEGGVAWPATRQRTVALRPEICSSGISLRTQASMALWKLLGLSKIRRINDPNRLDILGVSMEQASFWENSAKFLTSLAVNSFIFAFPEGPFKSKPCGHMHYHQKMTLNSRVFDDPRWCCDWSL